MIKYNLIKGLNKNNLELFHGVCLSAQYNINEYHADMYKSLGIFMPNEIKHAKDIRAAEFLAGRYLAALCLSSLQAKTTSVAIGANREPIFPKGFIGSISHSHDFVICMVSKQTDHVTCGIDVEHILEEKACHEIHAYVINAAERRLISRETHALNLMVTLSFSIKEAVFKALFPLVNKFFDFNTLDILEINWQCHTWSARLNYALTEQLHNGMKLKGNFAVDEYKVISWVNSI